MRGGAYISEIIKDVNGRIIAIGNHTTYMYNEKGIVSQEVYTETDRTTGKIKFWSRWDYADGFLYITDSRGKKNKKVDGAWWEKNKTATKILEENDPEMVTKSIWRSHWHNARTAKTPKVINNLLRSHLKQQEKNSDDGEYVQQRNDIISYLNNKLQKGGCI